MILFDVQKVRKYFGPEPVLDGVTFEVRAGERIALVGPNGCGKTTLLRILAGQEQPDGGACRLRASTHVGFLEQQPLLEPGRSLRDEAADALANLLQLQQESLEVAKEISKTTDPAEHARLAARFDHLQHELSHRDAYNLDHKIERVLQGLGFRTETFDQPADSLSGGEQNRLMLAKLLLAEPNVMLLDEPSNHLDIGATEWLEDFLLASTAAVVVVSHDRYFLDKVTTRTLELFRGTVDSYTGNFSAYWQQKDERLLVQQRTYERQQTEIAKAKEFIRRNAYGMKSAQAEDRRKKLARMEAEPVDEPREIAAPVMGFPKATRCGDIVLRARRLAKAYERTLFEDVDVEITRGQRWGLLGPNGSGKTTLLRCLLGSIQPDAGSVQLGAGVQIGYFDQQLAELDQNIEVVEAVRPPKKEFNELQRRSLLARFGLTGDKAFQRVDSLSGGEQCRAALARLAAADANFLVLDEPTNHLDLWARDALERTLAGFDGTVLFVSHDRFFVDQVADHLLIVEPDGVRVVEGNYQTYQRMKAIRKADTPPKQDAARQDAPSAKQPEKSTNRDGTTRPTRRFPYRKVSDLEEEIFEREVSLKELQDQLALGETHRDGERVRSIMAEISEQEDALRTLYEHWEEASELNW
ncbi:MAG TPA: ABC-F family ATP-binding cassette domain-containing protein [Thermoguttaceae bacterium]|nr:ABC-F family ATP-binding cassette domain-containing protein [Thermoguttaceae bacterium]